MNYDIDMFEDLPMKYDHAAIIAMLDEDTAIVYGLAFKDSGGEKRGDAFVLWGERSADGRRVAGQGADAISAGKDLIERSRLVGEGRDISKADAFTEDGGWERRLERGE